VLVSTHDPPGSRSSPRTASSSGARPGSTSSACARRPASVDEALARLAGVPAERAAAVVYEEGRASLVESGAGLDTALVDRLGHEGIAYHAEHRRGATASRRGRGPPSPCSSGRPRSTRYAEAAARGETMPQKSTYFYPKLLSGLLFFPA